MPFDTSLKRHPDVMRSALGYVWVKTVMVIRKSQTFLRRKKICHVKYLECKTTAASGGVESESFRLFCSKFLPLWCKVERLERSFHSLGLNNKTWYLLLMFELGSFIHFKIPDFSVDFFLTIFDIWVQIARCLFCKQMVLKCNCW